MNQKINHIIHYMKIQINIFDLFRFFLKQPLSVLRFLLSILFGKKLIENLESVADIANNETYSLSKTWFLDFLPEALFHLDANQITQLKYFILVSSICAALGLLGRLNLLILAFIGYFLFGTIEGIGVFDHHLSLPCQVILVLALVTGTMKISIDYTILNLYYKKKNKTLNFQENHKWGLNLILGLIMLTYLTAGISKFRYGNGTDWLNGSTLSFYLKERTDTYKDNNAQLIIGDNKISDQDKWKDKFGFIGHTYGNYQTSKRWNEIANYIASNKPLVILLSIGSVLFELLGFMLFINTRYRNIYLICAIIFHMSIGQLMGISFRQYRVICFCLIDWEYIFKNSISKFKNFRKIKKLSAITH